MANNEENLSKKSPFIATSDDKEDEKTRDQSKTSPFLSTPPPADNGDKKETSKTSPFLSATPPATAEEEEDQKRKRQESYENSLLEKNSLFYARCKLYRKNRTTGSWESRGIGKLTILKDNTTGLFKISMFRDSIKTLGCNHYIDKKFEAKKVVKYENSYMWATVTDFCNTGKKDEASDHIFLVKFENGDDADKFKEVYDLGVKADEEKKEIED